MSSSFLLDVALSFRTGAPNGLLLFAYDNDGTFLSLELLQGSALLQFQANTSSATISELFYPLADLSWHSIVISIQPNQARLTIDGSVTSTAAISGALPLGFTFTPESIFVGGVPDFSILPSAVSQTAGLVGCATDFELNLTPVDLLLDAVSDRAISQCQMGACATTTCSNGGVCVEAAASQEGFLCRCPLFFTGETCQQGIHTYT